MCASLYIRKQMHWSITVLTMLSIAGFARVVITDIHLADGAFSLWVMCSEFIGASKFKFHHLVWKHNLPFLGEGVLSALLSSFYSKHLL